MVQFQSLTVENIQYKIFLKDLLIPDEMYKDALARGYKEGIPEGHPMPEVCINF